MISRDELMRLVETALKDPKSRTAKAKKEGKLRTPPGKPEYLSYRKQVI